MSADRDDGSRRDKRGSRVWDTVVANVELWAATFERWWSERSAAGRALGPSYPIGAIVLALLIATTVAAQGREILLVIRSNSFETPGSILRFVAFFVSLLLFSATVLTSVLFVLASDQRQDNPPRKNTLLTRFEAKRKGIEADPVHTSIRLRARTAYFLAVAVPASVFLVFLADLGRIWDLSAWSASVVAVIATLALVVLAPLATRWRPHLRLRRGLPSGTPLTPAQRDALAAKAHARRRGERRIAIGVFLVVIALTVYVSRQAGLQMQPSEAPGAFWAAELSGAIVILMALVYRWMGGEAMVVHSDAGSQFVVIDSRFHRIYHFVTGVLLVLVIGSVWVAPIVDRFTPSMGATGATEIAGNPGALNLSWMSPLSMATLGPGAVFFFGALGLVVGLAWLIRGSNSERPSRPAMRVKDDRHIAILLWLSDRVRLLGLLLHPTQLTATAVALFVVAALLQWDALIQTPGYQVVIFFTAALVWVFVRWLVYILFANRPPWLLVIALFLAMPLNESHHVDTLPVAASETVDPNTPYPGLDEAEAHAAAWLRAHPDFSDPEKPIVAVVVLAEGGGIRATVQSARYLAELDDASGGAFFDNVYTMSGVSGGSIGLAIHLASQAEARKDDNAHLRADVIEHLSCGAVQSDHFSPLLAGLFGSDIPAALLPVEAMTPGDSDWFDRADFFESSLERAWMRGGFNCLMPLPPVAEGEKPPAPLPQPAPLRPLNWLQQPTADVARSASATDRDPIMLFSAVRANDGVLLASSNVYFETCDADTASFEVVDTCLAAEQNVLPLSAAAHLSARFPYINPAAVIDHHDGDRRWYVDGAYYDNSGAVAAGYAVQALFNVVNDMSDDQGPREFDRDRLRVVVVHMYARTVGDEDEADAGRRLAWLSTPVQAVLQARGTRGLTGVTSLCRQLVDSTQSDFCETLSKYRSAAEQDPSPLNIATCAFQPDGAANLLWINAPLDVAKGRSTRDALNIPLGWLIQSEAHRTIGGQAAALAPAIWGAVQTVLGEAPREPLPPCTDR